MIQMFKRISALATILMVAVSVTLPATKVFAAPTNTTPAAKVSFTFDDGLASAVTQAAPTLAKYGYVGTNYAISGCIGMTTVPNTCHANTNAKYMSWAQLTKLQNTYKWEIGSHTNSHPYLASFDATDGQPAVLTPAQVTSELTTSKATFATKGITTTDFATPYGDYNNDTLAQIAKFYASHRGFADTGYNSWPNNDYLLRDQQVQGGVSVATVKGYIDNAIATNQWLVLSFHDIKVKASTNPDDYEYKTADLDAIAAYVKSKNVTVTTVNNGLVTSAPADNLLATNSSFNSGITDGWTTDASANITKDTATNGSYPDATNSIKFVATTTETHLFSPQVAVTPSVNYMLKSFLNVKAITSGEIGFYVDEYDANGNWISGQYKKAERTAFVENINFAYTPTSVSVAKASLQVFATANSGITAYLDNVSWFPLTTVTPPAQTNLLTNSTFDNGLTGWTTDNATAFKADATSNGSAANPVNSVKVTSTTKNAQLFSAKVAVTNAKSYSLSSYVNLKSVTAGGEVGFYIDEYDASGNWISGQYKTGARVVGSNTVAFQYTPSSANVKQSSLQVIATANSGLLAYFDNPTWYAN